MWTFCPCFSILRPVFGHYYVENRMRLSWIMLWMLLIPWCLQAQEEKKSEAEAKDKEKEIPEVTVLSHILQLPVSPDEYTVGAGDQLAISIWGQVNEILKTVITPEDVVIIPTVGVIELKHLSLTQAKERIITAMKASYVNAEINVNILAIRQFKINVTGQVMKPQSIVLSGVHRVSDAIALAGGLLEKASSRNIIVIREKKDTLFADLTWGKNTGDLSRDPLLYQNDVILVPKPYSNIFIEGAVRLADKYEFVAGETLKNAIRLAGGLKDNVDSTKVELTRFTGDGYTEITKIKVDLRKIFRSSDEDIALQSDDRIFISSKTHYRRKTNVIVEGEVHFPGNYTIIEGTTTLSEVLGRAGGFTPDASIQNIMVTRSPLVKNPDPAFERLQNTPIEDMTDDERAYFKAKSRQLNPLVQTNYQSLFSKTKPDLSQDVFLKDDDRIIVPPVKSTITLIGGIVKPGIYDVVNDADFSEYLTRAGGFTEKAKQGDVKIIKANTGVWLEAGSSTSIADGDVIFVPEKEPVDKWAIFRDILTTVGQIAIIASTIVLIYDRVNR